MYESEAAQQAAEAGNGLSTQTRPAARLGAGPVLPGQGVRVLGSKEALLRWLWVQMAEYMRENGLFDKLQVQGGVTLNQDGKYDLIGRLSTPDGIELGTAAAAISGTAGSSISVDLDFDASICDDPGSPRPSTTAS